LVGVILAFLFFAPLEDKQEVSIMFRKDQIDTAPQRLALEAAQYRGQDNLGRPFILSARQATQQTSANPVVEIADMNAQIQLNNGPARLAAGHARYNMDTDHMQVVGPIAFTAADGYRMDTSDVDVDLRGHTMASRGAVAGHMPIGQFTAGQLQGNLPDRTFVLTGRPRLHIVQGGLR
jgi:lipopolysaccharide export system protein LptC